MQKYLLWVMQALEKQGYCLISSAPEKIQDMPWSEVYRFKTTQGNIYFKKTPPSLAIESNVIKLLAREERLAQKLRTFLEYAKAKN